MNTLTKYLATAAVVVTAVGAANVAVAATDIYFDKTGYAVLVVDGKAVGVLKNFKPIKDGLKNPIIKADTPPDPEPKPEPKPKPIDPLPDPPKPEDPTEVPNIPKPPPKPEGCTGPFCPPKKGFKDQDFVTTYPNPKYGFNLYHMKQGVLQATMLQQKQ